VIGVVCVLGVLSLLRRVIIGVVIAVIATSRAASAVASATTRTVRGLVIVVTTARGARLVIVVAGIVPVLRVVVFDLHDLGMFGLRHSRDQPSFVEDGGAGARFRRRRGCRGGSGEGIARIEVHRLPAGPLAVVRLLLVIRVPVRRFVSADVLLEDESPVGHGVSGGLRGCPSGTRLPLLGVLVVIVFVVGIARPQ